MSSIETLGLGAGSYYEPNESEEKEFMFDVTCSVKSKVYIRAKTKEEAEKQIENLSNRELIEENYEVNLEDWK